MVWVGLVLIVLGIWPALSPRTAWRVVEAWQYRDPEANEPSDLAFAISRVASIVLLVVGAGMVVTAIAERVTADPCDSIEAAFSDRFAPGTPGIREGVGEQLATFAAEVDAIVENASERSATLVATDGSWQMAVEITPFAENLSTIDHTCLSPAP